MAVVPLKFRRLLKKLSFKNHSHQADSSDGEEDSFNPTPTGFLPIYVGEEKKRYLVPTAALDSAVFQRLFDFYMADEYDDVTPSGPFALPCSSEMFEILLRRASPAGFLPLYIGEERKPYLVPTAALNSAAFKHLFDFDQYDDVTPSGPLALPCSVDNFEYILRCASRQIQRLQLS